MASILIVDDEQKMRHLLSIILEREGYRVDQASNGQEAYDMVQKKHYDMAISDIKMPVMDGTVFMKRVQEANIPCPVVFITAFATVDSAVEAMRHGAADYITKPFETDRILLTVERTLRLSQMLAENRELKSRLKKKEKPEEIIYVSETMASLIELAGRVAETDSAVLISGESGTGKELLAQFIHYKSPRSERRFVPVNCAAISAGLVESELFGHEKGAFTGAERRKQGKFEYAAGGTLFLDEIGDLPLEAQAKLLRALQEKKIQRVGGNEEIPVDVRFVCATNRHLPERIEAGDFREDLYYRVNVFPLSTPPLRERKSDILPLANHFIERTAGRAGCRLAEGAVEMVKQYHWPGNVRELANAMERAVILSGDSGNITADTLSFLRMADECGQLNPIGFRLPKDGISLEKLEADLVRQALEVTNSNQTAAARLLGLTRAKFRVLMKQVQND